jgi:beta-lactam-binding protein with PASTA domain
VTILKRAGFVVSVSDQPTDDPLQVGKVTNQFPPGGSRGSRGDSVSIVIGTSPATTP